MDFEEFHFSAAEKHGTVKYLGTARGAEWICRMLLTVARQDKNPGSYMTKHALARRKPYHRGNNVPDNVPLKCICRLRGKPGEELVGQQRFWSTVHHPN